MQLSWHQIYFWSKTTNTLQLPYGMISPTLFELAATTSVRPIGKIIHFDLIPNYVKAYNFNDSKPSYSAFILNNIRPPSITVFDAEHMVFLSYWLNAVVFCSRSLQMQPRYFPLAIMLHEGHRLCLAKSIIAQTLWRNGVHGDQASTWRFDQPWGLYMVFTTIGQCHLPIYPTWFFTSKSFSRHRRTSTLLSSSRCSKKYSSDRWILLFFQTPSSALFLRHKGFTLSPYSDRMVGPSWFTCSRIASIPFD